MARGIAEFSRETSKKEKSNCSEEGGKKDSCSTRAGEGAAPTEGGRSRPCPAGDGENGDCLIVTRPRSCRKKRIAPKKERGGIHLIGGRAKKGGKKGTLALLGERADIRRTNSRGEEKKEKTTGDIFGRSKGGKEGKRPRRTFPTSIGIEGGPAWP